MINYDIQTVGRNSEGVCTIRLLPSNWREVGLRELRKHPKSTRDAAWEYGHAVAARYNRIFYWQ